MITYRRYLSYFAGLFAMTIGIALSVKSDLGVSPVSTIPYTMTCVWGIEMGRATIVFHFVLVLLQLLLLRRRFKPMQFMQIAVGVVFGYFTTFCNYGASLLPTTSNIAIRLLLMLLSTVFVAIGIFLYMPPKVMPLAGEGVMQAVSDVSGVAFPKVKIGFDVSMVVVSLITCLVCIGSMGSVGVGTIIAAFMVGAVLGFVGKRFGAVRDRWLMGQEMVQAQTASVGNGENFVVTIAREYGSGGREIGRKIAEQLGVKYYDWEVLQLAATDIGTDSSTIEGNDQSVASPTLQSLYYWCVQSTSEADLPIVERVFEAQKRSIISIANRESCVIVGRLANFILADRPNRFSVFIGAYTDTKVKRVAEREGISSAEAQIKIERVERERANHCLYFTGKQWKDIDAYDLYIKSDMLGLDATASLIVKMIGERNSLHANAPQSV